MKNIIKIFFLQFSIITFLSAQEVHLEIKNEISITKVKFNWLSNFNSEIQDSESINNFSIGLNGRLTKMLYLKATFGQNDFESEMAIRWDSENFNHRLEGKLFIKQNYLEFLPELRFFKGGWVYLNMGVGFAKVKSSELTEGYYSLNSDVYYRTNNFPDFRGNYEYFVGHLGFNISIKNIGIILEYGLRISGFTEAEMETLGMGVNQNSFKFGLQYRIM